MRMSADGSVKASQMISKSNGGFTAELRALDMFGVSMAAIGDLDGDNVTELAVGAWGDDEGGGNAGAVYVLFLRPTGMVRTFHKIPHARANLYDSWGTGIAALGDADDDGVPDMAVGGGYADPNKAGNLD